MANSFGTNSEPTKDVASLRFIEIAEQYTDFYARGQSHTAKAKRLDLRRFTEFLRTYVGRKEDSELLVIDWSFSATRAFVDGCLKQGEAPATVSRRLATLKHMGRTLSERMAGFINPAREVKPPKIQPGKPKALEPAEIVRLGSQLMSGSAKDKFTELRNQTLIALLLATGLRADEVRTLRMKQLESGNGWLDKVRTKGNRFRRVYISEECRSILERYLEARPTEIDRIWKFRKKSEDLELPLFISVNRAKINDPASFRMGAKTIWRIVRSYSDETPLHPHLLRHTFATELLESSKDIRLVAQALGHSDVRVTMRYTERGDEDVADAIERKASK